MKTVMICLMVAGVLITACNDEKGNNIAVTGVRLNKTALPLLAGTKETLKATVLPSNATNQNIIWSSDDSETASVDGTSGEVTAIAGGTAIITATTEEGGKTATCTVTVATVAVTGVTLNKTSLKLVNGAKETLQATVLPSNASNRTVKWSSNNNNTATVDAETGEVTAIVQGTATITATTEDGNKTAACIVTVIDAGSIPDVSALSVDKSEWMPTTRQLTNTAVEKAGTVDISGGSATATLTVNKSTTYQEIWGFGASIVGPAENFEKDLSVTNQNKVFDLLFSNEDDNAGLTIVRMNIQPRIHPNATTYNWEQASAAAQAWFAQEVYKRYPCPITAAPWAPPVFMKDTKQLVNGGYLLPQYYDDYVKWLYDWAEYNRETLGLNIKWLSIQNEPNSVGNNWDECGYTPQQLEQVTSLTVDYFRSKNSSVAIGGPECGNDRDAQNYLDAWSAETLEKIDWTAHHGYQSINNPPGDLDFRKYGKPVLMTEQCGGASGVANSNDVTMDIDGLRWAFHIGRALSRDERGFVFWQLVRSGTNSQSLLRLWNNQDRYEVFKRTHVFAQYSRFIRPGYIVVDVNSAGSPAAGENNYCVIAAKHPATGNTSVIIANKMASDITVNIKGLTGSTLGGRITNTQYDFVATKDISASGGDFIVKVPAKSVVSVAEK